MQPHQIFNMFILSMILFLIGFVLIFALKESNIKPLYWLLFKRANLDINKLNYSQRERIYKKLKELQENNTVRIFKTYYKNNIGFIYSLDNYNNLDKQITEENLIRLLVLEVLCTPLENGVIDSFLKEQEKMKVLRKELNLD